jgi:predicted dehydrogenase
VLVEKPVTDRLEDADELVRLAEEGQRVFHVGHVERFNPAVDSLRRHAGPARFVEAHRLASFAPRSLDVDVVLDLMIHDLDIVLALDGSEPVQVDAVGVSVLTGQVDIASVRLRFASGLVANLTASRVSAERVRKFRVFAPRTYISADLLSGAARVHRLAGGPGGPRIEVTAEDGSATHEPLRRQHEAFVRSVRGEPGPGVTGREGRRALALARTILERIAEHNRGLGPAGPPGGTR